MKRRDWSNLITLAVLLTASLASAQSVPVKEDPLVRMPGSQPAPEGSVSLEAPGRCLNCHAGYNTSVEPGHNWKGSMMAQSARDFLFWACLTTAAQDSQWAVGRPNATDICLRCHFPKGWLEGRSDPPNGTAMIGADWDGVQCDFCHTGFDPFFEDTSAGTREGSDWLGYWDETDASDTPSSTAAADTYGEDAALAQNIALFNGDPFFGGDNRPQSSGYDENGSGQYFVSSGSQKRAPFADAAARHQMLYSRYHKSKYFCATCHDVSNPILANHLLGGVGAAATQADFLPGSGSPLEGQTLYTENNPAYSYFHVERTFSEFMLSDYGQPGGAEGIGPFAPGIYETSNSGNKIAKCQDCHMRDVVGTACNKNGVPVRPNDSLEHPQSGQPLHDLTGGNIWVSWVLASATPGAANYDAFNDQQLNQGPSVLTLDLSQGEGIDPVAMLDGVLRAKEQLELAAAIEGLTYDAATGALSFRVQNQTGHKLISGFPEGRRMFVNIRAYAGGNLIYETNPYDAVAGTLKGLSYNYQPDPNGVLLPPVPLTDSEAYVDELVYEAKPSSIELTGEEKTFHFALATERYKDNRIPPQGFRIAEAAARLSVPRRHGDPAPDYFTADEYAGGYDEVSVDIASGADTVEVSLYYQTTSREYIEFLRDEINGTGNLTLPDPDSGTPENEAYIVQTDPFFSQLTAWGDTIWNLWTHNMNEPGAAPYLMAQATIGGGGGGCDAAIPTGLAATPGHTQVTLTWDAAADALGYRVYYDQSDKGQFIAEVNNLTYTDTGLTNGQQYCYKVTSYTGQCESDFSGIVCATPDNQAEASAGVDTLVSGFYTGKGKNKTFTPAADFAAGDGVVLQAHVVDAATGQPVAEAVVEIKITGPETHILTSGPSDAAGVAEATWNTQSPNKRGQGGTATGGYTVTVTGLTAGGYTWDGVMTSIAITIN
jgi:hypothetical protein